ncbi:Tetraacyldisaccharide 4'-kinase [Pirellulimonas nuda]|uniref:Tetraacyldisaccharide 4'-kinase n=1 Tax=Pirellulimonas nuda TaxID=2528009 RepID=A0A518DJ37_9BACT|nr:tetraacyldisaccharide 4'-kinase [Pirellulimonas nuda]QDU91466.1 Tetraacyldisaccharide 4'-kinase [Pirellulimonas nuda]
MISPQTFHDIASGRRRGPGATAARGLLWCAQAPYAAAIALRNRRFDRGADAVRRVTAPVISVGNLTLGGSGKTPMVKWVARYLRGLGVRVALVSRGYGAEAGARNDEALELETELPDVPHVQNPDRVAAAELAIEEFESQAILMDDGFQHRRLARDLDIVLIDATAPWGYGWLLPRGALREPIASLRRAQVVCLTRRDLIDEPARDAIRRRAMQLAPDAAWCEAEHRPSRLLSASGRQEQTAALRGKRVAMVSGIGNPAAFRATLAGLGCEVVWERAWPDHHRYDSDDIAAMERGARESGAQWIVCTHKDLVKIGEDTVGDAHVWAVVVEMAIVVGEGALRDRLDPIVANIPDLDPEATLSPSDG